MINVVALRAAVSLAVERVKVILGDPVAVEASASVVVELGTPDGPWMHYLVFLDYRRNSGVVVVEQGCVPCYPNRSGLFGRL